jgi:hypothetical protein
MQNRRLNIGPVALTTTLTTNILNVGTGAMATPPVGYTDMNRYIILRHITVTNKTAGAVTVSLWKGATGGNAAGTEFQWNAFSVAANSYAERYGEWRFDSADFLVGGSNTTTALTFEAEGEIGCAG